MERPRLIPKGRCSPRIDPLSRKGDVVLEVALRQKIYVNPSKLKLLECLGFSKDDMQWFTGKEEESHIHICHLLDTYTSRFAIEGPYLLKDYRPMFHLAMPMADPE
ncbi:hypothetical protein Bca101_007502 [Brassica carinata]